MVYSQTKRTAAIASITNRPQGGGNKKAGLMHQVGVGSWSQIHRGGLTSLGVRFGYGNRSLSVLKLPMTTTVSQSRPIGVTPSNGRYFSTM